MYLLCDSEITTLLPLSHYRHFHGHVTTKAIGDQFRVRFVLDLDMMLGAGEVQLDKE